MATNAITDSSGNAVTAQQGESCDVVLTFKDLSGATITKANLITLTLSLFDQKTSATINSRSGQNVIDANGGSVATDGTLTLRLQPDDNPIVSSSVVVGASENHVLEFTYSWNDGVLTRTGKSVPYTLAVEKLAVPT